MANSKRTFPLKVTIKHISIITCTLKIRCLIPPLFLYRLQAITVYSPWWINSLPTYYKLYVMSLSMFHALKKQMYVVVRDIDYNLFYFLPYDEYECIIVTQIYQLIMCTLWWFAVLLNFTIVHVHKREFFIFIVLYDVVKIYTWKSLPTDSFFLQPCYLNIFLALSSKPITTWHEWYSVGILLWLFFF